MGLTDQLLDRFIDANRLSAKPDFPNKRTLYFWPGGGQPQTEEEIRRSAEFAGFVDGVQGKPNKLRPGVKGSAQRDENIPLEDELYAQAWERENLGAIRDAGQTINPKTFGYNFQFCLGRNCKD